MLPIPLILYVQASYWQHVYVMLLKSMKQLTVSKLQALNSAFS